MRADQSRDFLVSTDPAALSSCANFLPAKRSSKETARAGSIKFIATMLPERSSSLSKDARHPGIYNVTDSTPATQLEVYSWLADHFHRPLPSYGPPDLERKRGWTNKRVCNRTLRKMDWQPTYPAYRDAIPTLDENRNVPSVSSLLHPGLRGCDRCEWSCQQR